MKTVSNSASADKWVHLDEVFHKFPPCKGSSVLKHLNRSTQTHDIKNYQQFEIRLASTQFRALPKRSLVSAAASDRSTLQGDRYSILLQVRNLVATESQYQHLSLRSFGGSGDLISSDSQIKSSIKRWYIQNQLSSPLEIPATIKSRWKRLSLNFEGIKNVKRIHLRRLQIQERVRRAAQFAKGTENERRLVTDRDWELVPFRPLYTIDHRSFMFWQATCFHSRTPEGHTPLPPFRSTGFCFSP